MRQKVSASLEPDFADNTSATAAHTPNESNRGGRGGCLGFFEHMFSLEEHHKNDFKRQGVISLSLASGQTLARTGSLAVIL
jgi:hypothetical protein